MGRFKCQFCQKIFREKSFIEQHIRVAHQDLVEDMKMRRKLHLEQEDPQFLRRKEKIETKLLGQLQKLSKDIDKTELDPTKKEELIAERITMLMDRKIVETMDVKAKEFIDKANQERLETLAKEQLVLRKLQEGGEMLENFDDLLSLAQRRQNLLQEEQRMENKLLENIDQTQKKALRQMIENHKREIEQMTKRLERQYFFADKYQGDKIEYSKNKDDDDALPGSLFFDTDLNPKKNYSGYFGRQRDVIREEQDEDSQPYESESEATNNFDEDVTGTSKALPDSFLEGRIGQDANIYQAFKDPFGELLSDQNSLHFDREEDRKKKMLSRGNCEYQAAQSIAGRFHCMGVMQGRARNQEREDIGLPSYIGLRCDMGN